MDGQTKSNINRNKNFAFEKLILIFLCLTKLNILGKIFLKAFLIVQIPNF